MLRTILEHWALQNRFGIYLRHNSLVQPIGQLLMSPFLRYSTTPERVCTPYHDLIFDGFPRSANSYGYNLINEFFPGIRCVHHTHSLATVKWGQVFGVPIVLPIRSPASTIASNIERSSGGISYWLKHYRYFYKGIRERIDSVHPVSFETITERPRELISIVSALTGKEQSAATGDIESVNERIFNHLETIEAEISGDPSSRSSSPRRESSRAELETEIRRFEGFAEIRLIFEEIREHAY